MTNGEGATEATEYQAEVACEGIAVSGLTVSYGSGGSAYRAVDCVSFRIAAGTTLALVGESGAGKTTVALAIPRLLPPTALVSGEWRIRARSVLEMPDHELRELRRREISFVFQDPVGSLIPGVRVGTQVARVVAHRMGLKDRGEVVEKARQLLTGVGLTDIDRVWTAYPRELSGGMCQRVMLALALSTEPTLVIADEPLSALDAVSQVAVLQLLMELQRRHRFAMLYVTHDLRVAARFDQVGVLKGGKLVELGATQEILKHPQDEYTQQLVTSAKALSLP